MFGALNEKYIELFSVLFASRNVLPKKQLSQMEDALMAAYKRELAVLTGHISLETSREMFELKWKLKHYTPRGFIKNRVARAVIRACKQDFEAYLATLSAPPEEPVPAVNEEETALVPVRTDLILK